MKMIFKNLQLPLKGRLRYDAKMKFSMFKIHILKKSLWEN